MRWNDLNDGSIKTLLILALLAANIALVDSPRSQPPPLPQSAGGPLPPYCGSPEGPLYAARVPPEARDTAGEAPALTRFQSP